MHEPTFSTLAERLDRLEREVRWWRRVGGVALAVLGVGLLLGATPTRVADELLAKRLVIVDSQGKERILLGEELVRGIGLQVLDADGATRIGLMVKHLRGDNPYLHFRGPNPGWVHFSAELDDTGSPMLELFKHRAGDKPVFAGSAPNFASAALSVKPDGSTVLAFVKDGKVIWKAP